MKYLLGDIITNAWHESMPRKCHFCLKRTRRGINVTGIPPHFCGASFEIDSTWVKRHFEQNTKVYHIRTLHDQ